MIAEIITLGVLATHIIMIFAIWRFTRKKKILLSARDSYSGEKRNANSLFIIYVFLPILGGIMYLLMARKAAKDMKEWDHKRKKRNEVMCKIQDWKETNSDRFDQIEINGILFRNLPFRDHYMGVYPVTRGQWYKAVKTKPWEKMMGRKRRPDVPVKTEYPVTHVSVKEIKEFINTLNKKNAEFRFALPTFEEWYFALYANEQGKHPKTYLNEKFQHVFILMEGFLGMGKTVFPDEKGMVFPVGSLLPNPWGLYDMLGNVWEWCKPGERYKYYGGAGGYSRGSDLVPWGKGGELIGERFSERQSQKRHPLFSFRLIARPKKSNHIKSSKRGEGR